MVTDRYLHVQHHPDVSDLGRWARAAGLPLVAIDIVPGAVPFETTSSPILRPALRSGGPRAVAPPLSTSRIGCYSIAQFGSTRSINVGVAAGIAMHGWVREHAVSAGRPGQST